MFYCDEQGEIRTMTLLNPLITAITTFRDILELEQADAAAVNMLCDASRKLGWETTTQNMLMLVIQVGGHGQIGNTLSAFAEGQQPKFVEKALKAKNHANVPGGDKGRFFLDVAHALAELFDFPDKIIRTILENPDKVFSAPLFRVIERLDESLKAYPLDVYTTCPSDFGID